MMLCLIYCALYITAYFVVAAIFTLLTMVVIRGDHQRAVKIGINITQSLFIAVLMYYLIQANPLGISLQ